MPDRSQAQENKKPQDPVTYNEYSDIPSLLRKGLSFNAYRERYINEVVLFIRHSSHSKIFLSRDDLEFSQKKAVAGRQDLNPKQIESVKQRISKTYLEWLNLDPNQDGKLTAGELVSLAHKAFATVDLDGDTIISLQESLIVGQTIFDIPESCELHPIADDTQLVSVGIYEGTAISTVTTVGQEHETTAVTVHVAKNVGPLYMVLTSHVPTIWQFIGNTQAIHHLVVNDFPSYRKPQSKGGITGIAKTQIRFLEEKCIQPYYQPATEEGWKARSAIKQLVGRVPDSMVGNYEVGTVTLTSDDIVLSSSRHAVPTEVQSVPAGYHKKLWPFVLQYYPDGVANLDPQSVVSNGDVEPYEILPYEAGLAKLAYEGKIVPEPNAFKIVQQIPRFPAGLERAYRVTFILANNVQMPKGKSGLACIRTEDARGVLSECNKKSR